MKYVIKTEDELTEYLRELYAKHTEVVKKQGAWFDIGKSVFYSGCNFHINSGLNEWEPLGSATSMHDCDGCAEIERCDKKKATEIWFHAGA